MNKKFSTLAVAAMLASAFTAYAGPGDVVTKLAKGDNGNQYQLVTEDGEYLILKENASRDLELKLVGTNFDLGGDNILGASLWCVNTTQENQGQNPIFDFTNKGEKAILDVTVGGYSDEDGWTEKTGFYLSDNVAHVGGEVAGWEFAPVLGSNDINMFNYKGAATSFPGTDAKGKAYSLNSYIDSNWAATLVEVTVDGKKQVRVAVVKAADIKNDKVDEVLGTDAKQLKFILKEADCVTLTSTQFNTILNTRSDEDFVKMSFDKDYNNTDIVNPFSTNELMAGTADPDGFVTLYKQDANKNMYYLRVDTAYANDYGVNFLKFAFSDKNEDLTKSKIPGQYRFRLNYHPTTDELFIQAKEARYLADGKKWWHDANGNLANVTTYYWNSSEDLSSEVDYEDGHVCDYVHNWVKLQDLVKEQEIRIVTLGKQPINTTISFGFGGCADVKAEYTSVADGVYVIKNSKGQVLASPIYNDGWSAQFVSVDEQDPEHMPAYQWVVLKNYSQADASATSTVTITNREYTDLNNSIQLRQADGAKYMYTLNEGVGISDEDSLTFEAVDSELVKDQYLGYKKINSDSLLVNKYTFNYWHPYASDKYIAKSDKDSTLTVLNGSAAFGISEIDDIIKYDEKNEDHYSTIDIKYGFGTNMTDAQFKAIQKRIPGLAQLVRTVYEVNLNGADWRVNNNSQFNVGNGEDQSRKHYYAFFKENNHIDGKHYYAIVRATSGLYQDSDGKLYEDTPNEEFYIAFSKAGVSDYDAAATLKEQVLDETRTSAFAIERDATPLYRRFNSTLEGQVGDGVDTLRFYEKYRNEYLMIEANPNFMVEHIDFLGIDAQDKAQGGLAFIVDTAWVNRGAGNIKPQYLISIDRHDLAGTPGVPCTYEHNHYDNQGNAVDAAHCSHAIPATPGFARGKYLINFHNLAEYDAWANGLNDINNSSYRWNMYDRAGFKEAIVRNDTLWILRDEFKNLKNEEIDFEAIKKVEAEALNKWIADKKKSDDYSGESDAELAATYPSYIYDLTGDNHKYATWSMRFYDRSVAANEIEADRAFLFESMKNEGDKDIAPEKAAWLKMQNGCLVLADDNKSTFNDVVTGGDDALIFNVEHVCGDKVAVDNENIAIEGVSVVAGNGQVTIMGAAGKNVTITNILGKVIANQTIASDNATIAVPAGIVAVAVEGEAAVKAIVK